MNRLVGKSAQGNDVQRCHCILISLQQHCHYKVRSVPPYDIRFVNMYLKKKKTLTLTCQRNFRCQFKVDFWNNFVCLFVVPILKQGHRLHKKIKKGNTGLCTWYLFIFWSVINDRINCRDCIVSVTDECMSMKHQWDDTDREKVKY